MAFHREQAAKEFEADGITPEAARYAAMRQFGNATLLEERSHEVMGFRAETSGTGPAIRGAAAAQKSRTCGNRHPGAGAGHWGKHGNLSVLWMRC